MRSMNYQQNNYQQQNNNQNNYQQNQYQQQNNNQNYNNKINNPHNPQFRMMKIYLYYKTGKTQDGRRYRVPHTVSFGFDMTVSLNGNSGSMVQYDPDVDCDYIIYDPLKCGVSINKSGYLTLQITD